MNTNIGWLTRSFKGTALTGGILSTQTSRVLSQNVLKLKSLMSYTNYVRPYSLITSTMNINLNNQKLSTRFMSPVIIVNLQQSTAGMKTVANPKRRCKHCYIVIEEERKYVFCDKFPRHKQMAVRPGSTMKVARIMTHATQGGKRKNGGQGRMGMWTQQGLREDY